MMCQGQSTISMASASAFGSSFELFSSLRAFSSVQASLRAMRKHLLDPSNVSSALNNLGKETQSDCRQHCYTVNSQRTAS